MTIRQCRRLLSVKVEFVTVFSSMIAPLRPSGKTETAIRP